MDNQKLAPITKNNNELVYISDLLERWPGALHKQIINLNKDGILKSFWVDIPYDDVSEIFPCKIEYRKAENAKVDDWIYDGDIYNQNEMCVVLLEDVEKIEADNPNFKRERIDLDKNGIRRAPSRCETLRISYEAKFKKIQATHAEEISKLQADHEEEISTLKAAHEADAKDSVKISPSSYCKFISLALCSWKIEVEDIGAATDAIMRKFKNHSGGMDKATVKKIIKKIAEFRQGKGKDF